MCCEYIRNLLHWLSEQKWQKQQRGLCRTAVVHRNRWLPVVTADGTQIASRRLGGSRQSPQWNAGRALEREPDGAKWLLTSDDSGTERQSAYARTSAPVRTRERDSQFASCQSAVSNRTGWRRYEATITISHKLRGLVDSNPDFKPIDRAHIELNVEDTRFILEKVLCWADSKHQITINLAIIDVYLSESDIKSSILKHWLLYESQESLHYTVENQLSTEYQ